MSDMANTDKKMYGLLIPKKNKKLVSHTNVFGDDNEESKPARKLLSLSLLKENDSKVKRDTQIEIDKALSQDPNIYDYDGAYDAMKAEKAKAAGKSTGKDDKAPKYIQHLLKAAEARKRNQEKLAERKVQKERENEGDEFDDKEVFVTGAYRQKMQEMQDLEEEEKKQAELEAKMDVTKQNDLSGFYRHLLDQTAPVKEEPMAESKASEGANTMSKASIETGSDSSIKKEVDDDNLSKPKTSGEENIATKSEKHGKPKSDKPQTPNSKSKTESDIQHLDSVKDKSSVGSSKIPESRESEINEYKKKKVETDKIEKFKKDKLPKSPSPLYSTSNSSDSETERYNTTGKKSEKHSKYEHRRGRKSEETPSDSDSSEGSRGKHKHKYPHNTSRHEEKHKQTVKESASKNKVPDHSSFTCRGEEEKRKPENEMMKTSPEKSRTDVLNDNKNCKESVSSNNRESLNTKLKSNEKKDLKRYNESECEKVTSNKYARRTTEEEIEEARARYLARKLAKRR